jgi:uncharacterized membrane protein YfcA
MTSLILLLGLAVGVTVGMMGVGGGIVLVPLLGYLLGFDQHTAQGTSLLLQLPPIGIGGLYIYWKKRNVNLHAGLVCALGFLLGGYFGSFFAVRVPENHLRALFGFFLMFSAVMLWRQTRAAAGAAASNPASPPATPRVSGNAAFSPARIFLIFLVACGVGVMGGMFGVGGGVMLVPLLVLVFHFEQHTAQGTSLVALVPPTGLLAFLGYAAAGKVDYIVGLLLMPGVFLGAMLGSQIAHKLSPRRMRRVFAVLLFFVGAFQVIHGWVLSGPIW